MSVGVEALLTIALGLQVRWVVKDDNLDTVKRRIDFEIGGQGKVMARAMCKAAAQRVHERLRRNGHDQAATNLQAPPGWDRCCRLEPFKTQASTVKGRFDPAVRGMVDHCGSTFVKAMNGLPQQANRAARRRDRHQIHRLLAHVQAQAPAASSHHLSSKLMRMFRSTRNGRELTAMELGWRHLGKSRNEPATAFCRAAA